MGLYCNCLGVIRTVKTVKWVLLPHHECRMRLDEARWARAV